MDRRIIRTGDGSDTIVIPDMNVSYHSKHGAIQESMHVYVEAGLRYQSGRPFDYRLGLRPDSITIFEMGFGTGLNAFLTAIEASKRKIKIHYTGIEKYPLTPEEISTLNYTNSLKNPELFNLIHQSKWNEDVELNDFFALKKIEEDIINYSTKVQTKVEGFTLIYYDAFAPSVQPELWTEEIFEKLYSMLLPGGTLVTFCSKSTVRRAMQAAGFEVVKIPGPQGKREMVRAHLNPPEGRTFQHKA